MGVQGKLSEEQAGRASVNDQLQQEQQRCASLQTKAAHDRHVATAAAAAEATAKQIEMSEQQAQQLQAQLVEAQSKSEGLQSKYDVQSRQIKHVMAELSIAKASTETLQASHLFSISCIQHHCFAYRGPVLLLGKVAFHHARKATCILCVHHRQTSPTLHIECNHMLCLLVLQCHLFEE